MVSESLTDLCSDLSVATHNQRGAAFEAIAQLSENVSPCLNQIERLLPVPKCPS